MTVGVPSLAQSKPAGSASAQSNQARAAELFKKASESYRQGRFQEAVTQLEEARTLDPQPVLTYNLARAYEGLGDLPKAADAYERYLHDDPNAPDRGSIEQRVATLRAFVVTRVDVGEADLDRLLARLRSMP